VIDSLTGRVIERGEELFLETGPVVFRLQASERSRRVLAAVEGEQRVFVALEVREDRMDLVGFARREERDLYGVLKGISGVGTRLALSLLSTLSLEDMAGAVASGDAALLSTVPGVGKKTASRLLLELKDRLPLILPEGAAAPRPSAPAGDPRREAVLGALMALGMSRPEAGRLYENLPREEEDEVEELIRRALAASARS